MNRILLLALTLCIAAPLTEGAQSTTRPLVKELAYLVVKKPASSIKGKVTLGPVGSDCRQISVVMDLTDASGEKPVMQNQEIFLQGAQLVVNGTVCLPTQENTYVVKGMMSMKLAEGTSMKVISGKLVYDKPIGLQGNATMEVGDGTIVEIKGDAAQPLVLSIQADGFAYVSGRGRIKTAQGKTSSFPK